LLPKFIGEKIIIKKMKEYLYWVIDVQTARVGYDFEQRLEKSKLDFRWEMLQRIEATIEGIGAAIEKGMTLRSRSENEATERRKQVSDGLARFDEIKDRLMKLREDLGVIIKC
jgi:FKBP-type peptidyl-prolyl cis-trans isomerase 2